VTDLDEWAGRLTKELGLAGRWLEDLRELVGLRLPGVEAGREALSSRPVRSSRVLRCKGLVSHKKQGFLPLQGRTFGAVMMTSVSDEVTRYGSDCDASPASGKGRIRRKLCEDALRGQHAWLRIRAQRSRHIL
jgi:hypothetical protein